ncbi:LysR family transcriptional regulator [Burkholderia sp. HI2761]|uniref:LysR family transcriptional regulator n=1 Tax=unclassified Burkholderia TaxID=2613784 RepID=UPI000B7A5CC5|nr:MULTISPECIES: LysR substrate-binding domain-containing protein [unclassified Burkholderia]MPV59474.1 LysR family transcriptional regulator [Burkholderia sp. BE24]OXJ23332.1 LysR family transcriptional regulator [Burkholderia sp. HI2761]
MKLKQLDAFLAVAEHRTIRGAARALGVTQPAVSSTVRELELELGVPLVMRSVKGIALTDYGSAFAIRARLIVEEIQRTRDEIEQLRLGTTGSVSIAVSPTVALTILPRAFDAFARELPDATVNVDDALTATDLARLRDGSLDFIVTHQLSNAMPDTDEFASIPLFRTAFAVVARNRHRLVRARSLRELTEARWCVPRYGEGGDDLVRSIFTPFSIDVPKRVIHCPSFAATLGLVSQTDALGVFARPLADVEHKSRAIVALNLVEPLPALTVAIVMRRHALLTPAALHFIECLKTASATVAGKDDGEC